MMKLHPRQMPILGNACVPGRFIFGDATDQNGLEACEYVVHTSFPQFICRLTNDDTMLPSDGEQRDILSEVFYDTRNNTTLYVCDRGLRLYDFTFYDSLPTAEELQSACDEAVRQYFSLHKCYRERELKLKQRKVRIGPLQRLAPAERDRAARDLMDKARAAVSEPMGRRALSVAVHEVLCGGDYTVLTESQLGLFTEPDVRKQLIDTAKDCIALPDVVRQDGTVLSFELWALPLIFLRMEGGIWWYFPMLDRIKPTLAEVLGLSQNSMLLISPTIFTVEMLNEYGCQNLIHLAPSIDAGYDFVPVDIESMRTSYEHASKTIEPQLVMAWLPFLVEKGKLSKGVLHGREKSIVEAVMPIINEVLGKQMEYHEAELLAPLPWWEAISVGTMAWNRKRLGLTLGFAIATIGTEMELEAVIEYQPEAVAYAVDFRESGKDTILARTFWLVVPDVVPDRMAALKVLQSCLREVGVNVVENVIRLH